MYHHYSIQPTYHYDVYQQCPVNPIINEVRNPAGNTPVKSTQYDHNTQNVQCSQPEKAAEQTQSQKTVNSIKKSAVDTSNFSIEERLVAAVWVHERKRTNTGISQIKRDFRERFQRDPPAKNTLLAWERKLFSTGNVCDAPRPGRPANRSIACAAVRSSLRCSPALSERARARLLRLPRSTLRAVLRDLAPGRPRETQAKPPVNTTTT